jgi:hypothetical protein
MYHHLMALSTALLLAAAPVSAQAPGNLLRNGNFQDDWLTLLPANKNHHWCYSSEFYNRRDFNPDAWSCKGSWQWLNAEAPRGQRRLVLQAPEASITQRVNAVLVHDGRSLGSMADAGAFPNPSPQRSATPERLLRDLTLRVRLKGENVPAKGGAIELGLCPPGALSIADPLGTVVAPTVTATAPLPVGTFGWQWLEVKLPAAKWLEAVKAAAVKDPKDAAEVARAGPVLPGVVSVTIRYQAAAGKVEIERAELIEPGPSAPNLLFNGGFETAGATDKDYPAGWGHAAKYRHFPGRLYYLFNTWHNSPAENRGKVQADSLVMHGGARSLQMIVPAGDEVAVAAQPVVLNQKEPRLVEVSAWVRTDSLCMLHLDAVSEKGERLDGFSFVNMAPLSVGTDEWRLVRQVFRPRQPVQSVRLLLCARGVNGSTLDDTGMQPQNNVVGTVWWDDVSLFEPESTAAELSARGVKPVPPANTSTQVHLADLDLGERLLGDNVLRATLVNAGPAAAYALRWEVTSPSGNRSVFTTETRPAAAGEHVGFQLPYQLTEPCPAYREYRGRLTLLDGKGQAVRSSEIWFGTWTTPIDLRLGALYLRPGQKQLVRLNLGLSAATRARLATVRLEVVRQGTGQVLKTWDVPATPAALAAQRDRIPADLRGDFANLLLTDLDVSFLPPQAFNDPQRNWLIRATAHDTAGKTVASAESAPFCRQGHEAPQPAIQKVVIKDNLLYVNDQPLMPWGGTYGHIPVYDGPADPGPGKYRDLHNLPPRSIYDRFSGDMYNRKQNDFNCFRYVAGAITDPKLLAKRWQDDNLYCSSAFVVPVHGFTRDEVFKLAGGKDKLDAYLTFCKTAPMVVSTAPGIEEAFGNFHAASALQLKGLGEVVDYVRRGGGRPVMVGHGGYWNRLEFEKIPYFDIYDPETEPLYPANLHTDLLPLVRGKDQVIWLRPQMYEAVPYERWRFHAYVELMRGCRGWQFAHGPGDVSLFRGLHGEMEFWKPIVYSRDAGPKVSVEPWVEHWSRRHGGKTYLIAATTRGLALGKWSWHPEAETTPAEAGRRSRATGSPSEWVAEDNAYGIGQPPTAGPSIHGIQYLPDARTWPAGSKLVQWVHLDAQAAPKNLVVLVKTDGRWTHAASWGKADLASLRKDPRQAYWFLRTFYRHSSGFLGWDDKLVDKALAYVPAGATDLGELPSAGRWIKLEVPLEKIGASGGLLDGVGFFHDGGRVRWGYTSLVAPDGTEQRVWGDSIELPADVLARVRVNVAGLKAGSKVRVLFEDRELSAADGHFVDDFRGQDLYQRYGGDFGLGYGSAPVALHLYEIPDH